MLALFMMLCATAASASNQSSLEWLIGTWNLCNARQARLDNTVDIKTIATNNEPQCSDHWPMIISSLDEDPDTFVNFKLEAPFMAACEKFGIPTPDTDCNSNGGKTWVNMTFVGSLSLNPRLQSNLQFIGKRSGYKDLDSGDYEPISTTLDGELTTLTVDVTNHLEIYVDWMASGRRWNEMMDKQHDILSVRSWKMVKDLEHCDKCGGDHTTTNESKSSKATTESKSSKKSTKTGKKN